LIAGEKMTKKITLLLILIFTIGLKTLVSQVSIAPVFVFMDDRNRFSSFVVLNGSNQNQEISVDFLFGYSSTDSLGNGFMVYDDPAAFEKYSVTDWVRASPRTFVLEPGQRQTVRINARPPQTIADGMYWTRIRTTSNPQIPSVDDLAVEGVRTQITFRFEQVTALFYKKGALSTGLNLSNIRAERDDNQLFTMVDVVRTGNAPFFGSAQISVRSSDNRVVAENTFPVSIYFDGTRRFSIPVDRFQAGTYTIETRFESQRNDMPSQDIVQISPVSQSARVVIP
jgi:hypothetical protein